MSGDFDLFAPFEKIDAERREVFGYASTPTRDQQGEIVTLDAVRAALPEYLTYPALREMHQPSAVGKGIEAQVDGKGLWFGAKIVDDRAWDKVKQGVYRGFSIGGRVTKRDPDDSTVVKGIELVEVSVVDRPCNPDASFTLVKRVGGALRMTAAGRAVGGVPPEAVPAILLRKLPGVLSGLVGGGVRASFGAWVGGSPFVPWRDPAWPDSLLVKRDGSWTDRATGRSGADAVGLVAAVSGKSRAAVVAAFAKHFSPADAALGQPVRARFR